MGGNNEGLFDFAYLRATTGFRYKDSFLWKAIVNKPTTDQTFILSTHQWWVTELQLQNVISRSAVDYWWSLKVNNITLLASYVWFCLKLIYFSSIFSLANCHNWNVYEIHVYKSIHIFLDTNKIDYQSYWNSSIHLEILY